MAFELLENNLSGLAVIDKPAGALATNDNFIETYDYLQKFQPELMKKMFMANGSGRIASLLELLGHEFFYESDQFKWTEQGRLHNKLTDVAISGTTFTSPTEHNAEVGYTIKISDGDSTFQATITAIADEYEFTATNDDGTSGFGSVTEADILIDYANSWAKGTENFTKSHRWDPTVKTNYTQIVKSLYERSVSDTLHTSWVMTPEGPKWTSFEIAREKDLHRNKVDLAQMTWDRKAGSGQTRGIDSIFSQIKTGGNIINDLITDIEEFSAIALRVKQQNPNVKEVAVYHNHAQGAAIRQAVAGVNAHYADGSSYGMFNNDKNMALHLNFKSIYIDGITFHFMPAAAFDDPTLTPVYGNINALFVPMGIQRIKTDKAGEVSVPYMMYGYRSPSRKCEVKIFGPGGTPQVKDCKSVHFLTETLNAIVGVNSFFLAGSDGFMGNLS